MLVAVKNNNVQGISVVKIGIVSLTDNEPEWEATENSPGINYIPIKSRKEKENVELDSTAIVFIIADLNALYKKQDKYQIW